MKKLIVFILALICVSGVFAVSISASAAEPVAIEEEMVEDLTEASTAVFDIADAFNDFWNRWGGAIIGFLTSGAFASIVLAFVRGSIQRFAARSKKAELTGEQLEKIADTVLAKIAGSVLDVDVSSVVANTTKKELAEMHNQLNNLAVTIKNQYEATSLMSKAISRSKLITDSEKIQLEAAADSLESQKEDLNKHQIKISLAPKDDEAVPEDYVPLGG